MTTLKLKFKINNSYESEPSSNSGSSANESNYYENNTDEEPESKLSEFFQPDLYYEPEEEYFPDIIKEAARYSDPISPVYSKDTMTDTKVKLRGQAINSSQESDFEGFTETQINEYKPKYFAHHMSGFNSEKSSAEVKSNVTVEKQIHKFYEMMIVENSSNAVDMKLPNINMEAERSPRKISITDDLSEFLTFNGKFKKPDVESNESEIKVVEDSVKAKINTAVDDNTDIEEDPMEMDVDDIIEYEPEGSPYKEPEDYPKPCDDLSAVGIINTIFPPEEESEAPPLKEDIAPSTPPEAIHNNANYSLRYQNERSPDLFGDDEDDDEDDEEETIQTNEDTLRPSELEIQPDEFNETNEDIDCTNYSIKREKELIKRIQNSLSGVPPPPSLTIPQLNMFETIMKNKQKILDFNLDGVLVNENAKPVLFKPSHTMEECHAMEWNDIYNVSQHGIHYNVSKTSEKIELLSLSVLDRYVGAETTSSYHISPSSGKKRNMRLKMLTQSPGSRLSHLAKRRSIFSSANLQSNSQKVAPSGGRQILLDTKKIRPKRKGTTPKRQTPGSRKKIARKTPSSSARKRLFFRTDSLVHPKPGPSRETSKRALFQSPAKPVQRNVLPVKPLIKPEIANRVERSKRALFSPDKSSQDTDASQASSNLMSQSSSIFGSFENIMKRKRTSDQCEVDDDDIENSTKIFRTANGDNLTPRALKIKSQSFCIGAGTRASNLISTSQSSSSGKSLLRASSDVGFASSQLSESHRKKLLWAVSQALHMKQISVTSVTFKPYASVLARVIKRLFLEFHQKSTTSTSDTMLKLAKNYVYLVMAGRTADEIYMFAKSKMEVDKKSSNRISGYVAPHEYEERRKPMLQRSSSCIMDSENSIDSFSFSQSFMSSQQIPSQSSEIFNNFSQEIRNSQQHSTSAIKLPIQPNKSLQNSSSKSNIGPSALRENSDCELRRSAQKNFTGKDQRNVSPYLERTRSGVKASSSTYSAFSDMNNSVKVRRQISFDN